MRFAAIPIEDERKLELHQQLLQWRKSGYTITDAAIEETKSAWRTSRLFSRLAFFLLSLLATSAFWGLCKLFELPAGVIASIAAVALAETLIRSKRFLRTGIEEGFYLAGISSFIFSLPNTGSKEGVLLFLAAFAWIGFRLMQPIFLSAAVGVLLFYLVDKTDQTTVGAIAAFVLFIVFRMLFLRQQQRASLSLFYALMTTALLPASMMFLLATWDDAKNWPWAFVALCAAVGAAAIWQALRDRDRALLLAGILTFAISVIEVWVKIEVVPSEWAMLITGGVMVAAGLLLNRRLAGRTEGWTSDRLVESTNADAIELAAATTMAASTTPSTRTESYGPDGGPNVTSAETNAQSSFGGAGASGEY